MFETIDIKYTPEQTRELLLQPVFTGNENNRILDLFRKVAWFDEEGKYKLYQDTAAKNIIRIAQNCKRTWTGLTNIWERCISSVRAEVSVKQCYDEFECTVMDTFVNTLSVGDDIYTSDLRSYILKKIQQGIEYDIFRGIFFGTMNSTDAIAAANPNFNYINGLWTVHIPYLILNNIVPNINAGVGVLGSGDGSTLLRTLVNGAPAGLRSFAANEKSIFVSSAVYTAIRTDIENSSFSNGFATQIYDVNGVANGQLYYQGIKIIEIPMWDEVFISDFSIAVPNYAMYTVDKNIAWGLKLSDNSSMTKIWTDENDYLKAVTKMRIGCDYVAGNLFSVATPVS